MNYPVPARRTRHDVILFRTPRLWPTWPFLPVVRFAADGTGRQCGVLYDARGVSDTCGYSATVFMANLFLLPDTETSLFARRKYVYDTAEELAADGWTVDCSDRPRGPAESEVKP